MQVKDEQLKEFIRDSGLASRKELARAEKKAKEDDVYLGETLLNEGVLSKDDLRRTEAYLLGIPFVDLKEKSIDDEVLKLIPEPIARKHNIVAFRRTSDALEVAMLDTDDIGAIEFVKKKVGLKIKPRLTDSGSMKTALQQYQQSLEAEFDDIIQKESLNLEDIPDTENVEAGGEEGGEKEEASSEELKELAEDLPVVKIVDTLLNHAILQGASDIHIEPRENQVLIRYRIDGILHDAMMLPKRVAPGIIARIKVLAGLKLDEKRLPQDGRFKTETEDQKVSFRVSVLPTYYGEKAVLRLLRDTVSEFTLESLGFHGEGLERVHEATRKRTGMVLTTGPTGSGKTTTLYTLLDILNTPEVNISTIEDPIEYQMGRVNQTQVKPQIGFTFSKGLRALVRQDPDIIMVGEIRDGETAGLAVNAALTGHLVLSTLHTNSAAGAMPRLGDMGVEPFLIVSTIEVVIAQRLVRKLCSDREKYFLSQDEQERLAEQVDLDHVLSTMKAEGVVDPNATWDSIPFYKPKGTEECEDGYEGRIGIYEVLSVSEPIKKMVMEGATSHDIETQAREEGMITMIEDGIFKAAQGLTTIEEVLRVVSE